MKAITRNKAHTRTGAEGLAGSRTRARARETSLPWDHAAAVIPHSSAVTLQHYNITFTSDQLRVDKANKISSNNSLMVFNDCADCPGNQYCSIYYEYDGMNWGRKCWYLHTQVDPGLMMVFLHLDCGCGG